MYRVTGFSPNVLRQAQVRDEDLNSMMGVPNWDSLLEVYAKHYSMTLWNNDEFIACGGCVVMWSGVGEAWIVAGTGMMRHGAKFYMTCKQGLDAVEKHFSLRRIQATVLAAQPEWIKFAKALGFKKEGTMFGYGPDCKDYELMARYRGWDRQ